jgi:hypothetical protein
MFSSLSLLRLMESRVLNQATTKLNAGMHERSRRGLLKGSVRMRSRRWSARDCPLGLARAKPMDVDFERWGDSRESVEGRDGDTTPPKIHFFLGDT